MPITDPIVSETRHRHKQLHDLARWFAISMLERGSGSKVEAIESSFGLAKRFLKESVNEWKAIKADVQAAAAMKETSAPGAAEPWTQEQIRRMGMPDIQGGSLSGGPVATVPRLDTLRRYAAENGARARELAERLVAAGPKAASVSASETHEIRDAIIELLDLIEGDLP